MCVRAKCRPSSPSANANRIKNFLSTPLLVARARDFVLRKGFGPRVDLILNCRRGSSGFGNNIVSESERILLKRCGEQCSNKRNPFLALCGAPSDSVYSIARADPPPALPILRAARVTHGPPMLLCKSGRRKSLRSL
jgi:hypothetical protein